MKKNIYLVIAVLISLTSSCQTNHFKNFENELENESFSVEYESIFLNGVTIYKPIISGSLLQKITENIISKKFEKEYCQNIDCEINIKYTVGHSSNRLLSIRETISTMFRLPRDIESIKFFNFIYLKNELYEIKLNRTSNLEERMMKILKNDNTSTECNYQINDLILNIYIKNGLTYVHIYKDEICNKFIKMNLNDSDLSFVKL